MQRLKTKQLLGGSIFHLLMAISNLWMVCFAVVFLLELQLIRSSGVFGQV